MRLLDTNKCLVVLSGGQDSITCLGMALRNFAEVEAISFRYKQRHEIEINCAMEVTKRYKVKHTVVDLSFFAGMVTSGLLGDGEVGIPHPADKELPNSFVPNRNALFLTLAHAHAQEINARTVMTGVCQTDYSGYPDCRNDFIRQLNVALNLGYETNVVILTPMMFVDKAETFKMAADVGFLGEVLNHSHTCYNGDHTTVHEWGFGCGECPACKIRAAGWGEFLRRYPQFTPARSPRKV